MLPRTLRKAAKDPFLYLYVIAAVVVLIGSFGIGGGFYSDDREYLLQNTWLQQLRWTEIWQVFIPNADHNLLDWQPARDLVLWFEFGLFGESSTGYKVINLVLYAGLVFPVYWASRILLSELGEMGAAETAVVVTSIFMLHPNHVESIQWVSGVKDLLMALFCFAAIPCWIRWLEKGLFRDAALSSLFVTLAVLSKGMSIAILGPLWLIGCIRPESRSWLQATKRLLPVAIFPGIVFSLFVYASRLGNLLPPGSINFLDRPAIILGGQALIALVPYPLSIAYAPYGSLKWLYLALGAASIVLIVGAAVLLFKRKMVPVAFGILFFGLTSFSHLQLVPFATNSMIADRFNFVPIYGLAIAMGGWLAALRRPYQPAWVGCLVCVLAALTVVRTLDWRDPDVMHQRDVERTQSILASQEWKRAVGHFELATGVVDKAMKEKRFLTEQELYNAVYHLGETQTWSNRQVTNPQDVAELSVFGSYGRQIGQVYEIVHKMYGDHPYLGYNAALHSLRQKEPEKAVKWARMALETPGLPGQYVGTAYRYLGIAYGEMGDIAQANVALLHALESSPADPKAACFLERYNPGDPLWRGACTK